MPQVKLSIEAINTKKMVKLKICPFIFFPHNKSVRNGEDSRRGDCPVKSLSIFPKHVFSRWSHQRLPMLVSKAELEAPCCINIQTINRYSGITVCQISFV